MGIRRYEVTNPARSAELREEVGKRLGTSVASLSLHVDVREVGVDIPAADDRSSIDFNIAAARPREGGLNVIGSDLEGATVHLSISPDDEAPAELTITTAE